MLFIFLIFFYLLEFTLAMFQEAIVNLISLTVLLYIIRLYTYSINYDTFHDENAEWIYSFIITSKLKYFHCIYIRNVNYRLHYWYTFSKNWIGLCMKEFKLVLNTLPITINLYFTTDRNYIYNGVISIIELYNEDFKTPILESIHASMDEVN